MSVVSNGANWGDNSVLGMKQLVTAYRRYGPDAQPGSDVIDGYLQSQALHQVLERAVRSGDLSREGLADAAAKVGMVRFDGLSSDYAYAARGSDRRPPRRSTIFAVDPEKPGALQTIDRAFTSAAADHVELPAPPRQFVTALLARRRGCQSVQEGFGAG